MIELSHVTKNFPGVKSLDSVSFAARSGEIHALLGENGAGKSTLIKIVSGAYMPDEGTIFFDGAERRWNSPKEAKDAGIHVIYQELTLFPELTVAENVFVGRQPHGRFGNIDRNAMFDKAAEVLARLGHRLDPRRLVKDLTVADQQMVEIAKALVGEVKLLILDEPTAVISGLEADLLFDRMRALRAAGVCVIYISHRLDEIFRIADRITILKDGKLVGTGSTAEIDRDTLVTMMVGRELADIFPQKREPPLAAAPVLTVRDIQMPPRVKSVSFELYEGEVLGIAGLIGSGRSELAHAIFGSMTKTTGAIAIAGEAYESPSPKESIRRGVGFLTEDRKGEGLLMLLDAAANISAPLLHEFSRGPALNRKAEMLAARTEIARFQIAVPSPASGVRSLSGGNQQKILFARWTRACHRVLILDEPTRGVDVGAKVEIYRIIRTLADEGIGIIVISSELPEVVGLCTRVLVMREGLITGELRAGEIKETSIMRLATFEAANSDDRNAA